MTSVSEKQENQKNKIQKAQELHKKNSEERAKKASDIKSAYLAGKDGIVLTDIVKKATTFAEYHVQLAKDGIGYRNTGNKLSDGSPEQELYYFTPEKRTSELDKAVGIEELLNYIKRQIEL